MSGVPKYVAKNHRHRITLYGPTRSSRYFRMLYPVTPGARELVWKNLQKDRQLAEEAFEEKVRAYDAGRQDWLPPRANEPLDVAIREFCVPTSHEPAWRETTVDAVASTLSVWLLPYMVADVRRTRKPDGSVVESSIYKVCAELDATTINLILDDMGALNLSSARRQNLYARVLTLVDWGKRRGFFSKSMHLAEDITRPRTIVRVGRTRIPSWDDIVALATAIETRLLETAKWAGDDARRDPRDAWRYAMAVYVAVLTGLRHAELFALRVKDLELSLRDLHVKVYGQVDKHGKLVPPKHRHREGDWAGWTEENARDLPPWRIARMDPGTDEANLTMLCQLVQFVRESNPNEDNPLLFPQQRDSSKYMRHSQWNERVVAKACEDAGWAYDDDWYRWEFNDDPADGYPWELVEAMAAGPGHERWDEVAPPRCAPQDGWPDLTPISRDAAIRPALTRNLRSDDRPDLPGVQRTWVKSWHGLRHYYAVHMLEDLRCKPTSVQNWLGHAKLSTTLDMYAESRGDDADEVTEARRLADRDGRRSIPPFEPKNSETVPQEPGELARPMA